MPKQPQRKGFTLVEALIVMSILAILFAEVLPEYVNSTRRSHALRCSGNLRVIQSAKAAYLVDHIGSVTVSPTDPQFLNYFPSSKIPSGCPSASTPTSSPYANVGDLYMDSACPNNCPLGSDIKNYPYEIDVGAPDWYRNGYHDLYKTEK